MTGSGLQIHDLVVEYTSGPYAVRPIDGLSASVPAGSLVLLLGPSGCGKTTMLSCLGGILQPTSGSIHFGDNDIVGLTGAALTEHRRRGVGIVFQAFNLVPSLSATENVMAPMRAAGVKGRAAQARAVELLVKVGLEDRVAQRPGRLSGGQQQRVAIARALAMDPPLVLADEPTAHLDYLQVEGILRLLRGLADAGRTVVVSTHDDRMLPLADQVIEMQPRFAAGFHGEREPVSVAVAAGATLFRQRDRADLIYVVDEGEVSLERQTIDGDVEVVAIVGAGQHFGELGPLFGLPRAATARATRDTTLTGYTPAAFRDHVGPGGLAAVISGRASVGVVRDSGRR
jgi:putative ABC transport system ATP-binding protein